MFHILTSRKKQKPPTLYVLTLQFFIFGITTTSMQSLKILHHFLVDTTVSLNRWKCYSWFQKGIGWDAFKASSSSILKVRNKLALMNVWWRTVMSENMLRQIKEHETRRTEPQSCWSWKAVMPDIFWVVELVNGKHCIWKDELEFTLYISKDNLYMQGTNFVSLDLHQGSF